MTKVTLSIFALLFSLPVFAGISTNGASFAVDQDNAWFLGNETIGYCIEQSPQFPISREKVRELVAESFQDWTGFFKKYGLDQMTFSDLSKGRTLKVDLNFAYRPSCMNQDVYLEFKVGISDADVDQALEFQDSALALVVRGDYDHKTYFNSGTLWFRTWPYSSPAEFKHVVLHEIGHVMGMEHNSVHVMDENLANRLQSGGVREVAFGQIESPTWKYRFQSQDVADFTFNAKNNVEPNAALGPLKAILGFPEGGSHSLKLEITETNPAIHSGKIGLVFTDKQSGRAETFNGLFFAHKLTSNGVRGVSGPILYTKWFCTACGADGMNLKKYLDTRASLNEADGSFIYKGKIYPAVIEQRKGLILRMFIPEKGIWWSTEPYAGSYYLN
jgi:hypothetical protein